MQPESSWKAVLHIFIRICTNLFNPVAQGGRILPRFSSRKQDGKEYRVRNGNTSNTEGPRRGIQIPETLHETGRPSLRRCKMGNTRRRNYRRKGSGYFRAERRRGPVSLVSDRN